MKRLDYNYIYNRTAMRLVSTHFTEEDTQRLVSTIFPCDNAALWMECSHGVGRDLKFIVLESQRVAQLNEISLDSRLVKTVTKSLRHIY